jgi:hypothetical protein
MSLFGWLTGSDKAAKAIKQANKKAEALTREGWAKSEALMLPGANYQPAQNKMFALLGLDGAQAQENAFGAYRESPEVAFMREQGEGALQRAAAAGGGVASGRTLTDATRFGQGLAQQGFGDYYSRLRDLYESTKGTAGGVAGGYTNKGSQLSNLALNYGQQKAGMAQQNSPWSVISGIGAIGADALGSWLGKPKQSTSIY